MVEEVEFLLERRVVALTTNNLQSNRTALRAYSRELKLAKTFRRRKPATAGLCPLALVGAPKGPVWHGVAGICALQLAQCEFRSVLFASPVQGGTDQPSEGRV